MAPAGAALDSPDLWPYVKWTVLGASVAENRLCLTTVTEDHPYNNPPSALDAGATLRTNITFDKFSARTGDMKLYYQSDGSRTVGNNSAV
jgi:hypothetical protein